MHQFICLSDNHVDCGRKAYQMSHSKLSAITIDLSVARFIDRRKSVSLDYARRWFSIIDFHWKIAHFHLLTLTLVLEVKQQQQQIIRDKNAHLVNMSVFFVVV